MPLYRAGEDSFLPVSIFFIYLGCPGEYLLELWQQLVRGDDGERLCFVDAVRDRFVTQSRVYCGHCWDNEIDENVKKLKID